MSVNEDNGSPRDENDGASPKRRKRYAVRALIVEGATVFAALMAWLLTGTRIFGGPISMLIAFACFLYIVAAPITGIILGIFELTDKNRTVKDTVLAVTAIAVPVVAILTVILLFSSGVWILVLM